MDTQIEAGALINQLKTNFATTLADRETQIALLQVQVADLQQKLEVAQKDPSDD